MADKTPKPRPTRLALREERKRTIDILGEAFASDLLDVDEYEERVTGAEDAVDCQALISLREDLAKPEEKQLVQEPTTTALTPVATHALSADGKGGRTKWLVAILGGTERKGSWRVPTKIKAAAILGGIDLDFREASFSPGVTDLYVMACMGGVEIAVPEGLRVECDGIGIMGGFEGNGGQAEYSEADGPVLRIRGLAIMGGVEVSARQAGESKRQAKKRRKRVLKAQKRKELSAKSNQDHSTGTQK